MNAKIAHTPGPWTVDHLAKVRSSLDTGKGLVADVGDGHFRVPRDMEQCHVNAHLIAAVPEMLDALEDAELRCTQAKIASTIGKKMGQADFLRGELDRIQAVCRAAIQKARG